MAFKFAAPGDQYKSIRQAEERQYRRQEQQKQQEVEASKGFWDRGVGKVVSFAPKIAGSIIYEGYRHTNKSYQNITSLARSQLATFRLDRSINEMTQINQELSRLRHGATDEDWQNTDFQATYNSLGARIKTLSDENARSSQDIDEIMDDNFRRNVSWSLGETFLDIATLGAGTSLKTVGKGAVVAGAKQLAKHEAVEKIARSASTDAALNAAELAIKTGGRGTAQQIAEQAGGQVIKDVARRSLIKRVTKAGRVAEYAKEGGLIGGFYGLSDAARAENEQDREFGDYLLNMAFGASIGTLLPVGATLGGKGLVKGRQKLVDRGRARYERRIDRTPLTDIDTRVPIKSTDPVEIRKIQLERIEATKNRYNRSPTGKVRDWFYRNLDPTRPFFEADRYMERLIGRNLDAHESLEEAARLAGRSDALAKDKFFKKYIVGEEGNVKELSVKDVIQHHLPKTTKGSDFMQYVYARLDLERRGAKAKPVFSELDESQLQKIVSDFELVEPDAKLHAQVIKESSNDMLDVAASGGVISQETADKIKTVYDNYVPITRALADGSKEMDQARNLASLGESKIIQQLKGGALPVELEMDALMKLPFKTVQEVASNRVTQMIDDRLSRGLMPGRKLRDYEVGVVKKQLQETRRDIKNAATAAAQVARKSRPVQRKIIQAMKEVHPDIEKVLKTRALLADQGTPSKIDSRTFTTHRVKDKPVPLGELKTSAGNKSKLYAHYGDGAASYQKLLKDYQVGGHQRIAQQANISQASAKNISNQLLEQSRQAVPTIGGLKNSQAVKDKLTKTYGSDIDAAQQILKEGAYAASVLSNRAGISEASATSVIKQLEHKNLGGAIDAFDQVADNLLDAKDIQALSIDQLDGLQKRTASLDDEFQSEIEKVIQSKNAVASLKAQKDEAAQALNELVNDSTTGKYFIQGMRDGESFALEVEPLVADLLKNMDSVKREQVLKGFGAVSHVFKMTWTGLLNPLFAAKSFFFYDMPMTILNTKGTQAWTQILPKQVLESIRGVFSDSAVQNQLKGFTPVRYGASTAEVGGLRTARDLAYVDNFWGRVSADGKDIGTKPVESVKGLMKTLDGLNGRWAHSTRNRVAKTSYIDYVKKNQHLVGEGLSDVELQRRALMDAHRAYDTILPDYRNTTNLLRNLEAVVPFVNAGAAGVKAVHRGAARQGWINYSAKAGAIGALPLAGIYAWNMKQPGAIEMFQEMDRNNGWEEESSLIIALPNLHKNPETNRWEGAIRIPVSPEMRPLNALVGRTIRGMLGATDPNAPYRPVHESATATFKVLSGGNHDVSSPLMDVVNVLRGINPMTNKPLAVGSIADLPPEEQYTERTSEFAKMSSRISQGILSPLQADAFFNQWSLFGDTIQGGLPKASKSAASQYSGVRGESPLSGFYNTYDPLKARRDRVVEDARKLAAQGREGEAGWQIKDFNNSLKGSFSFFQDNHGLNSLGKEEDIKRYSGLIKGLTIN